MFHQPVKTVVVRHLGCLYLIDCDEYTQTYSNPNKFLDQNTTLITPKITSVQTKQTSCLSQIQSRTYVYAIKNEPAINMTQILNLNTDSIEPKTNNLLN